MEQYSFDRFGQIMPCPDRERCGAYLSPPLHDGTPTGCTGERKWCKTNFEKDKNSESKCDKKIKISNKEIKTIAQILEVILEDEI